MELWKESVSGKKQTLRCGVWWRKGGEGGERTFQGKRRVWLGHVKRLFSPVLNQIKTCLDWFRQE